MMKSWNRLLMALAVTTTLTLGQVTLAQEAVDLEVLTEITTAFENTQNVTSLHMVSQSLMESSGGNNGMALTTEQTQEFDLVRTEAGWNAMGSITSSANTPIGAFELGMEVISVDEVTYGRFNQIPEGLPLELPQEWVNLDELTTEEGNLPLATSIEQLIAPLMLPLDATAVTQMSVLPSDEIEGEPMRVYQVTLDAAAVLDSEAASLLNVGGATGFGGFPGGAGGGLPPQATPQLPAAGEIATPAPEDILMTFAVYIGENDRLIHRLYIVTQIQPSDDSETTRPGLQTTTIIDFSLFNQTVEITAPDINP